MISNYSHDHIALDTMNIMANGQYIDQIMTNNQFYIFILTPKVSRQVGRSWALLGRSWDALGALDPPGSIWETS